MATLYQAGKITKDFDGQKALAEAAEAKVAATRTGDQKAVLAADKSYQEALKKRETAHAEAAKVAPKQDTAKLLAEALKKVELLESNANAKPAKA